MSFHPMGKTRCVGVYKVCGAGAGGGGCSENSLRCQLPWTLRQSLSLTWNWNSPNRLEWLARSSSYPTFSASLVLRTGVLIANLAFYVPSEDQAQILNHIRQVCQQLNCTTPPAIPGPLNVISFSCLGNHHDASCII